MSLVTPRKAEPEMNLAEFVIRVESLNANVDIPLLRRAFEFSSAAHAGQNRASGEPFFNHCIQVALILAEQHLDTAAMKGCMGIWSMRERVALLSGQMTIDSKRRIGTRIVIEIPFYQEKQTGKSFV